VYVRGDVEGARCAGAHGHAYLDSTWFCLNLPFEVRTCRSAPAPTREFLHRNPKQRTWAARAWRVGGEAPIYIHDTIEMQLHTAYT
jgi:hypothetical protein